MINELLEKYRALLAENSALREENEILKARLGITDPPRPDPPQDPENHLPLAFAAPESAGEKSTAGNPSPTRSGGEDPVVHVSVQGAGGCVRQEMAEPGRQGGICAGLPERMESGPLPETGGQMFRLPASVLRCLGRKGHRGASAGKYCRRPLPPAPGR